MARQSVLLNRDGDHLTYFYEDARTMYEFLLRGARVSSESQIHQCFMSLSGYTEFTQEPAPLHGVENSTTVNESSSCRVTLNITFPLHVHSLGSFLLMQFALNYWTLNFSLYFTELSVSSGFESAVCLVALLTLQYYC